MEDILNCTFCSEHLPLGPRPVIRCSSRSKILVIGQAPGTKVHASGIPWDDASGKKLREWLGVDPDIFYDSTAFAIIPMGFCYPGKGTSGDLPPRKECAPKWHELLLRDMPDIQLVLLIGKYAQDYYLENKSRNSLTENVLHFNEFGTKFFPLPHPSPRNAIWLKKNSWFEEKVLPELKNRIRGILENLQ